MIHQHDFSYYVEAVKKLPQHYVFMRQTCDRITLDIMRECFFVDVTKKTQDKNHERYFMFYNRDGYDNEREYRKLIAFCNIKVKPTKQSQE